MVLLSLVLGYACYMSYGQIYVNEHAPLIGPAQIPEYLDTDKTVKMHLVASGGPEIIALDGKKYAFLALKNLDKEDKHAVNKDRVDKEEPEEGFWLSDESGKKVLFCRSTEPEYLPILLKGGPQQLNSAPVPKKWTYLFGGKNFLVRGIPYGAKVVAIGSLKSSDKQSPVLGLRMRPAALCGYAIVTSYPEQNLEFKQAQETELNTWLYLCLYMVVPFSIWPVILMLSSLFGLIAQKMKN